MDRGTLVLKGLLLLVAIAASGGRSHGAVIRVPADMADIQGALDAAAPGDTVLVAEGEYRISAPLTFRGKTLELRAEAGPEATIIRMSASPDDEERANVVIFENG